MTQSKSARALMYRLITASAATALLCGAAQASTTFPPRKPGFWETTMVMKMTMQMNGKTTTDNDSTPIISALCSDATTDALSEKQMTGGNLCYDLDIEKSGNVYTITGKCNDQLGGPGAVMTYSGTLTMQGDNAFHMVSQSSGPGISSSIVGDSKWLGACPAGVMPGDFGGMKNGTFVKHGNLLQSAAHPPAGQ